MSDVLKQTMEKRKRFTVVGFFGADTLEATVNHVLATDAETAEKIAIASRADSPGYCVLATFAGFQTAL